MVSIIIPCYNQASYLPETLQSVLQQTFPDWECIIVNDGSTDDTKKNAQEWANKDQRFVYTEKQNGGLSSARNWGLDLAKGDWIQFLDSDDILDKEKLSKSLHQNNANLVITDFNVFDESGISGPYCNLKKQTFDLDSIISRWDVDYTIPIHCGLFSAKLIGETRFSMDLKAKEDWFFWVEIFKKNPSVKFIPERLVSYRVHRKSMSKNESLMFEQTQNVQQKIYGILEEKEKTLFFNRITNELLTFRKEYEELKSTDDVYAELESYKKYKKKYYSIWYKKLFYKLKGKKIQ